MANVIHLIESFNEDLQVEHLRSLYEEKSFLNMLSTSRRELAHSSFICELLSADGFHKMGTLPLQLFLDVVRMRAARQGTKLLGTQSPVMFPALRDAILTRSLDIDDVEVDTEVQFKDKNNNGGKVDIHATCSVAPLERGGTRNKVKYLNVIIENKVYAQESDKQTERYYQHFNAMLRNKAEKKVNVSDMIGSPRSLYNLYVYLTPAEQTVVDGLKQPECTCKEFVQICYQDLLDYVIDPLLASGKLSPRAGFILEEYRRSLGVSFDDIEPAQDTKKGHRLRTVVMAIGKKEREDLLGLWRGCHKKLLTLAANEKNTIDDDDTDVNVGNGKRNVYSYKGQIYNMGRFVQAVVNDHLPDYTMDQFNVLFKDIINCIVSSKPNKSYFDEAGTRTIDGVEPFVFKQWTTDGPYKFDDFCKKALGLGWLSETVKPYVPTRLSKEDSTLLQKFYDANENLIITTLEVVKRYGTEDERNEVEQLLKRTLARRDRTTYTVTLQSDNRTIKNLSWGRLVLTILKDYVEVNPNITVDELRKQFGLRKTALKEFKTSTTGFTNYFTNEEDHLIINEIDYVVNLIWDKAQIEKIIKNAASCNYSISSSNNDTVGRLERPDVISGTSYSEEGGKDSSIVNFVIVDYTPCYDSFFWKGTLHVEYNISTDDFQYKNGFMGRWNLSQADIDRIKAFLSDENNLRDFFDDNKAYSTEEAIKTEHFRAYKLHFNWNGREKTISVGFGTDIPFRHPF